MRQIIKSSIGVFIILILLQHVAMSQCLGDNTFTGATDTDWGTASNWCGGCVPGGGIITGEIRIESDCVVSSGDANNYTFSNTSNLILADGITFTNNGTGTWTIENVEGTGTYVGGLTFNGTIKPGYTLPVYTLLEVQIDPNGTPDSGDEYILYVYPIDNSTDIIWANSFTFIGATDDWDGASNTNAIVADQGTGTTYAAGLCESLITNGCNWYLPAKNELDAMYQQLGPFGSGDMLDGFYFSSTEFSGRGVWAHDFLVGAPLSTFKMFFPQHCRCVRK